MVLLSFLMAALATVFISIGSKFIAELAKKRNLPLWLLVVYLFLAGIILGEGVIILKFHSALLIGIYLIFSVFTIIKFKHGSIFG